MLVLIEPDAKSVSLRAAALVETQIRRKPASVIGLAAGATPLGMYDQLVARHHDGLDFSKVTVFGLDEYLTLAPDHPASCAATLRSRLIDRVDLAPSRVHLLPGRPEGDLPARCAEYEQAIEAAGGLDLQILGIGVNGHIGFNEPGSPLGGRSRAVGLRSSTRATNRPIFTPDGEDVPKAAITMGVGTILGAGRVLLLATGQSKADAVAKAVEGPLSAMVPASALQLHPDAVMVIDEAAAAGLALRQDYKDEVAALLDWPGMDAHLGR